MVVAYSVRCIRTLLTFNMMQGITFQWSWYLGANVLKLLLPHSTLLNPVLLCAVFPVVLQLENTMDESMTLK